MKKLLAVTPLKLSVVLALLCGGALLAQDLAPLRDWLPYRLELKLLDYKFLFRGPVAFEPQVVIVAGDEKALEQFGVWGSWKRSVYASMLRNLFGAGADTVAFDMVWADEQLTGDPVKFQRLQQGFKDARFDTASEKATARVAATRARLAALDKAMAAAEKGSKANKRVSAAVADIKKARAAAMLDLEAAEEAARALAEGAATFSELLTKEASQSADDELVEVLSEGTNPTHVVQGYIAQTNSNDDPALVAKQFSRIASTAMDTMYLGIKSENASAGARVARTLLEMCEGKPIPCDVSGEELVPRSGMEAEELMGGARELQAEKAVTVTEQGVRVEDLAALKASRTVGPNTVMVEWLPGTADQKEKELLLGADVVSSLVTPLPKFADVGQVFGFYAAAPDADGVFRSQPLVYRYRPNVPVEDAAACTACNRRMLTPEKLEAMDDQSKCSEPCRASCANCLIHAFYLQSLALSLVQQKFQMTPVLVRNTDILHMQAIREVALLPQEATAKDKAAPHHISTTPEGRLLLNWYGHYERDGKTLFPVISAADVVNNTFDKALVKDKAVIFAVTAMGTYDQRTTPYDAFVPGVIIHATTAQNMLDGKFLRRPEVNVAYEALFILIMALLFGLVLHRLSAFATVAVTVVLAVTYWFVDQYLFFSQGIWVQLFFPMTQLASTAFLILAYGYLTVGREKQAMRRAFAACLDPHLVEELASDPETLTKLKGDEREASCMFSDIRGFTTLSENLTPQELTVFLNDYFTREADAIMKHQGYLDKYIGDAIMALFGAPKSFPDHAVKGCHAALDMMDELKAFKKWVITDPKWSAFCARLISKHMDPASFDIGIGLNTGLMRVGYMGSAQRTNYSALGDAVNLASRLEGQTKEYGVHIILGETTMAAAKGQVAARLLDSIRVKGKKEPVRIYELIGMGDPTPPWGQFIKTFETGIELYLERRFADAIPYFAQALREKPLDADYEEELKKKGKPRDLISAEYISRCMEYQQNPPPPDWDGVVTKTTK